jgi:hypothetical protein
MFQAHVTIFSFLSLYYVSLSCTPTHKKTGNVRVDVTLRPVRITCSSGKAIGITDSECVSAALVTQHTMGMGHILLSTVACPALPYFPTRSHKRYDFGKKLMNIKRCVLTFTTTNV